MNVQEFITEYDEWIDNYENMENNVHKFVFTRKNKCMWLKGLVSEKLDMELINWSNSRPVYYFIPKE